MDLDGNWMNKIYNEVELVEMDGLNYNWLDEVWFGVFIMNYLVNVSGGSEKVIYFVGVFYYIQGVNFGKQDYNRWNFCVGVDIKLIFDLKFFVIIVGNQQEIILSFIKGLSNLNGYGGIKFGEFGDYLVFVYMLNYLLWEIILDDGNIYYIFFLLNSYLSVGNVILGNKMSIWNYFVMENNDGFYFMNDNFSYDVNFFVIYVVLFIKGFLFKGSYVLKCSVSDSEQVFMLFMLVYLKVSDVLIFGNCFYSDYLFVFDY